MTLVHLRGQVGVFQGCVALIEKFCPSLPVVVGRVALQCVETHRQPKVSQSLPQLRQRPLTPQRRVEQVVGLRPPLCRLLVGLCTFVTHVSPLPAQVSHKATTCPVSDATLQPLALHMQSSNGWSQLTNRSLPQKTSSHLLNPSPVVAVSPCMNAAWPTFNHS